MSSSFSPILRKGNQEWLVGLPETSAGDYVSDAQNAELTVSTDSVDIKDIAGTVVQTILLRELHTLTVSGLTTQETLPEAGETFSYSDREYVITSASCTHNNSGTGSIVTLTGVYRPIWDEDEI